MRTNTHTDNQEWTNVTGEKVVGASFAHQLTALAAAGLERDQLRAVFPQMSAGDQAARAERAEAECLEQARLLGMSGEREAALLSKIELLERKLANK